MKSLMLLFSQVLSELGTRCCTSTIRDEKTVTERFEHEGISFLTISLPRYGNDLQKGLSQGFVDHDLFTGFQFRGGLPQLFGGFLDQVFDRSSGRLLDEPSIEAIHALRQLSLMFGKVLIPCSDARNEAALKGFVDCEQSVKSFDSQRSPHLYEEFHRVSMLLWADVFTEVDQKVHDFGILPKHGPGATADKLKGNQKYNQREWTSRLEGIFPSALFLLPNWSYLSDMDGINWLEPGQERPVKVTLVPKTLKTPRVIAIEPTCMQYVQQGLLEAIRDAIQADDNAWKYVSFKDQVPNQLLAQKGSLSGDLATLDLSEASDRVSNQLVRTMLRNHPHLLDGVDASRSRKAVLPDGSILRLAKFASMGSALCFPFEAMVFLTLIFLGIQDVLGRRLTRRDLQAFSGQVRVYGDDIIVPVEYVRSVIERLETFGFKVNLNKSFWTGKFRESCGKDYYDGHDVSIVRVRQVLPASQSNVRDEEVAKSVISTVSLRNQLYQAGMWQTVKWLDEQIERLIPFPAVEPSSPVLGRHSFLGHETGRMCSRLQRPLVRGYVVDGRAPKSPLEGYAALQKFFLKRGEEPFYDEDHLERYGRPEAVNIKLRWAPPF